ncbi:MULTISPECIES: hypothetical protein [Paraburkholderia]|jgi:hypothetical protein|uniref:Secreted protein n=1 Tax=Paraburkholderia phenazinium TaxID=60549 RepID=A0A1N6EB13_9BURK|nr:hypothetical protein [Paraburkholderia phenazinium]SIN80107.1 hypothetical protein SAMN05444168_0382 [Paraburkholderia phenazinium]
MNTRNIQTFLMVSAAFFAMSAPVRSNSASTLANAVACTARVAPARIASNRATPSSEASEDEQLS